MVYKGSIANCTLFNHHLVWIWCLKKQKWQWVGSNAEETYFDKISKQIKTGKEPFNGIVIVLKNLEHQLFQNYCVLENTSPHETPKYVCLCTKVCKDITIL